MYIYNNMTTSTADKSLNILRREYDKLKFGDYFYIKWMNKNFIFCDEKGMCLNQENIWENQLFILSTKLINKPIVLIGGAKYLTNHNKSAGLGSGFGSASNNHYGYDANSYAIYCYNLPVSENISKVYLIQKNGKLIYVTNEEHGLWKSIEDIYKINDESIFKITLTKIGWNIETFMTNTDINVKTQYITYEHIEKSIAMEQEEVLNTKEVKNEKINDFDEINGIQINQHDLTVEQVNINIMPKKSKHAMRLELINNYIGLKKTNYNSIYKKLVNNQETEINCRNLIIENN